MTRNPVAGVLDGYLSEPSPERQPQIERRRTPKPKNTPTPPTRIPVRRGRPPGKKGTQVVREKVTLRIDVDLLNVLRERSWVERRQFGELVEEALRHGIGR